MPHPVRLAPSILSADFGKLAAEVKDVADAGAEVLHVDVMDGHFVPNLTIGPVVVEAVRRATDRQVDVHLMIEHPERWVEAYRKAGADSISVHLEACAHLHRVVQQVKATGAQAGVAVNPHTPLEALQWVLEDLDFVLVMSVNPGFGGQKYIASAARKIAELRRRADEVNPKLWIEVDGGIGPTTAREVVQAGADTLVAGSAVFAQADRRAAMQAIRDAVR